MKTILTILFTWMVSMCSIFAFSTSSTTTSDTTFSLSHNIIHDTINVDFAYEEVYAYQWLNILNHTPSGFNLGLSIAEVNFPENWQVNYCGINASQFAANCEVGNTEFFTNTDEWLELNYSIQGFSVTDTATSSITMILYDVDNPNCMDTVSFMLTLNANDVPESATGFVVSNNIAQETFMPYSNNPVWGYQSIEIANPNDSYVELAWKVLHQETPTFWEYDYYSFYLPQNYFENQDVPAEGTMFLYPNESQYIEMNTGIQNLNQTPGQRAIEILVYDVNDSLNYHEILEFKFEVEIPDSEDGFMIFFEESVQEFAPTFPEEDAHFFHNFAEISNLNIFEDLVLGWEILNYDIPEAWTVEDNVHMYSGADFQDLYDISTGQSGTFTLSGGDYANIEYIIHYVQHNFVSDTAHLELLLYDLQDSAATAQVLSYTSILSLPEVGTGFEVWENQSSSVHYLQDPNESIFMYLSPLYVSNQTPDNIVEIAWKKLSHTIPDAWDVQYDFSVFQNSWFNEIPESGQFTLYPYNEAYFALNYQEVLTNGQAGETELQILVYDKNDSLNYNEVLTFRSSVCIEDNEAQIIVPPAQNSFCAGEVITLEAQAGLQNINWFNGQTGNSITVAVEEYIYVYAEDENGCPLNQELFLNIDYPYDESICVVSVDEASGKNIVVWEKTDGQKTSHFNIYKETVQADEYILIGTQAFEELSSFVDEVSNPNVASSRYKIAAVNECGSESVLSSEHKTMHLTINASNNSDINLIWEKYEGFDYPTFNILRGSNADNMQLIAQRPSNTFTYTDIAPPSGNLYYQIEVVYPGGCSPSLHAVVGTRSNIVDNTTVSTDKPLAKHTIEVYPNPASNYLFLNELPNDIEQIQIQNIAGQIILQKAIATTSQRLDVSQLPSGLYFVVFEGKEKYISKFTKK